ncbi:MAG: hypothetical protein M0P17_10025 [Methanoculleus sp.]|nr:hypothetical protein [Methanoculleus sp.]
MRRDVFPKARAIPAACCPAIALVLLAAETAGVTVTKHSDDRGESSPC